VTADLKLNLNSDTYASWGTTAPANEWKPIGDASNAFAGSFDGDGHTVSGIYISEAADYQGLFGNLGGGAVITDLSVAGSNMTCYRSYLGGIAAYNNGGTIQNCTFAGSLEGTGLSVGGIAGKNDAGGTVQYCTSTGSVRQTGSGQDIGGIAGTNAGTVLYCINSCQVSNLMSYYTGGIVGSNAGTVQYCYNIKGVTSSGPASYLGGIAGKNTGTVQYCYNGADLTATYEDANYVGGVVGGNSGGSIQYSFNTGNVTAPRSAGGVAGTNSGTVTGCYYDKQMCPVGGINHADVSGQAEGKLTTAMRGDLFSDTSTWTTDSNLYPRLQDPTGVSFDMDGTNEAILFATPAVLDSTDTVAEVSENIILGTGSSVSWTSSNPALITVTGGVGAVAGNGSNVTLTATRGSASRTVTIASVVHITCSVSYFANGGTGAPRIARLRAGRQCDGGGSRQPCKDRIFLCYLERRRSIIPRAAPTRSASRT
jgi:hypothetical protein